MDKLDQIGSHDGNTKKTRRVPLNKYWCLTLNNYEELDQKLLVELCEKKKWKYIIGKEVGESGTKHLQGFISCDKRVRLPEMVMNKRIHWEGAKAGEEANLKYCSKEGNYVTNFITHDRKRELLRIPKDEDLYDWQRALLGKIDESNDREILWTWSKKGDTGKTTLAKYLIFERQALMIDGKKADILHGATEYVKTLGEDTFSKRLIFILDLSRTLENYVSYDSIEKLKNGIWFSGKYESSMVMIPAPVVVVFANFPPDMTKMSMDRWTVDEVGLTPTED